MSDTPFTEQHPDEIEVIDPNDEAEYERSLAVIAAQAGDLEVRFTPAQKELVKAINPDANPAELQVFLYHAARTGLDPIAKQIYLVKRKGKMAIQTGIDGFRLIGHRSGQIAGVDDPVFTEDEKGIVKASVTIYRIAADGQRYPYTATAYWSEYAPSDLSDPAAFMWQKMPHTMIGKCAEALCWRKVCPAELSGIYTDDEMAQADFTTLGKRKAAEPVATSAYNCPKCLEHGVISKMVDKRKAQAESTAERKPPAWSCSAGAACKGANKGFGWGSWDPYEFDERETGGTTIEVTSPPPAAPPQEELAAAWDKADPQRPFMEGDPAEPNRPFLPEGSGAPPTQTSLPTVSAPAASSTPGSPPDHSTVVARLTEDGKKIEADFIRGLGATEVDRFSELLALVQVPVTQGGNDALGARLEAIARLMFEESIWPKGAMERMLTAWPQVPTWTALTRSGKPAVVKFATAVIEKAQKDIKAALGKEATSG